MKLIDLANIVAALSFVTASKATADITLAPVFGHNMVLQRDQQVPVWGWAGPGEKITVVFAGQKKSTTADSSGSWKVILNPLRASAEPQTLSIVAANRQLATGNRQLTNVLVGDVWLAAGQSNMEFPLGRKAHAAAEIPAATNALIRLLNLPFAGQASPAGAK